MIILFRKKKRAVPFRTAPAKMDSGKRPEDCEKHQSGAEQKKQEIKSEIPSFEVGLAYLAAHQPNEHEKTEGKTEKAEGRANWHHNGICFCRENTPKMRKVNNLYKATSKEEYLKKTAGAKPLLLVIRARRCYRLSFKPKLPRSRQPR